METFQHLKFQERVIVSQYKGLELQQTLPSFSAQRVSTFVCLLSHMSLHTLVIKVPHSNLHFTADG